MSCGTLVPARRFGFSSTGLLPPLAGLSFPIRLNLRDASRRPATPPCRSKMVWALPRSLAATWRIVLSFFSSGYLDVSVPRVPSPETMCSSQRDGPSVRRVPPFGYLRFSARLRLPVAFRSLPRPSSALGAKASALCSSSLDLYSAGAFVRRWCSWRLLGACFVTLARCSYGYTFARLPRINPKIHP